VAWASRDEVRAATLPRLHSTKARMGEIHFVCLAQSPSENQRLRRFTRTSICMVRYLVAIGIRRHGPTSESFEIIIAIDNLGDIHIEHELFSPAQGAVTMDRRIRVTTRKDPQCAWHTMRRGKSTSNIFHASPRLGSLQGTSRAAQSPWRWVAGLFRKEVS
jgi:hypothetical protein